MAVYAGTTETTLYLGGMLEKVSRGTVTEWKHRIPAGSGSLALHTRRSGATPASSTYYVTGDHLGSATTVLEANGALLTHLSFAAFGSRRRANWQDQLLPAEWGPITATTRRGFTGHEHLDNLSLVHMNGRVYDPKLGRFLSADPVYVGDLARPQTLNPYSYVGNNPLSAVDPSGLLTVGLSANCEGTPFCADDGFDQGMVVIGYVEAGLEIPFEPIYYGEPPPMPPMPDLPIDEVPSDGEPGEEPEPESGPAKDGQQSKPGADIGPKSPPKKRCAMSGSDRIALAGGISSFAGGSMAIAAQVRDNAPSIVRGLGAAGAFVSAATAIDGVRTGNVWDASIGMVDTAAYLVSIGYPPSVSLTAPYFLMRVTMDLAMLAGRDGSSGGSCVP